MKRHLLFAILTAAVTLSAQAKEIVGWTEKAVIYPGGLKLRAKIDTGAKTSSLNCECTNFFEKDGEQVIVNERDIVEIIAGPFKGDRAKVVRLVSGKDEVVIEPLNVAVPIPITLNLDDIRVIENKSEED